MATPFTLRLSARLILFAVLLSGVLLSLTTAPVQAGNLVAPLRQEDTTPEDGLDLSGVLLNLEDMPPGFEVLQENQMQAMSDALGRLGLALGTGSQIEPLNVTGYWNGDARNPQFIVSMLLYPLNEASQRMFDASLKKPDKIVSSLGLMLGAETQADLLEGIGDIGETSIGFAVTVDAGSRELAMNFISARRGEVVEEVVVAYYATEEPLVDVHQMAQILDERLAEVVAEPAIGFRPTALLIPELITHIPTPLDISTKPAVLGTNLLLAAIVMILLTIAVELANRTLEENEALLQRWFRPLRIFSRFFKGIGAAVGKLGKVSIIFSLLALALLILIYGLTFSLLEPGWSLLSVTGFWLFLCLTVGGGLVGLADDVLQWITARRWSLPTAIRVRPANLLLAFASTGASRLFGVVPGFMFGSPQAVEIDSAPLEKRRQTRLVWIGVTTALLVGLGLWLMTILTNLLQRAGLPEALSVAVGGLESLCLSIFALAVQNGFVQMLALPDSYGRLLQRRSRWIWALVLLAITFLFYHTLINPRGNLASAWGSVSVKVFVITSAVGMILSLLVWLLFRLANRRRGVEVQLATPAETLPAALPAFQASLAQEAQLVKPEAATPGQVTQPAELEAALPAQASQPAELETSLPAQASKTASQEITLPASPPSSGDEARFCAHCGKPIPAEARFCQFCGAKVSQQATPPGASSTPPGVRAQSGLAAAPSRLTAQPPIIFAPPRRRKNWPIILLVTGILGLLCCLAIAAVGWWQRERIPGLSAMLNLPTATNTAFTTPTPTRRSTSTPVPSRTPIATKSYSTPTATATSLISKLCLLPAGEINDGGFNALAWSGMQSAAAQYDAQSIYIELKGYTDADFQSAIRQFLPQGCNLIVGVGQLTAEAIRQAAVEHPQQKFLLLDGILEPALNNVWVQTYASDQGAFLAGYLAAAVSRTGRVGTFGGMDIPPVRSFMNGFAAGVSYYNTQHNTNVLALGWNITHQSGLFANDFNNPQQGQIMARELFTMEADILFPVAGPTGSGAAAEATTRSHVYIIGVDNDWVFSRPEYASVMLTSVEKRLDASLLLAVAAIAGNNFEGGLHTGTLSSEITLAPYHQLAWMVPATLQAELEQVKADILSGKIDIQSPSQPAGELVKSGELTIWAPDPYPEHLDRWVAKYEQANPEVKVNIVVIPTAEFVDRWKVSLAAGMGPDLFMYDNSVMFLEWARSGLMLPLDNLLAGKLAGFSKTALANLTVDGKLYGVPYVSYSQVLYYNQSLLPKPPGTMQELAQLVHQKKKITLFQSAYFLFPFFTAFGSEVVDSNGRCIADQSRGFVEALQYLQALSEDGALITTNWPAYTDQFRTGDAVMTISGPWMYSDYKSALGDDLGVALIPRGSAAAAPVSGLTSLLVNPNSRNPQPAVDLALFLASAEAQSDLDESYIPVRTDLGFEKGSPKDVFVQSAEAGYPEIWLTQNFYDSFESVVTAVLENGRDPASAVNEACQEMNSLNGK